MAEKKPIVLTEGQLEQLQNGDYLPNQPDVNRLYYLLGKLITVLQNNGVEIFDEELINLQH